MRHSPSVEPSTHTPLHPKLQRALGCLDTRLEEELARYRRQKAGHSVPPADGLKRKQTPNLDLMAIASTAAATDRGHSAPVPPVLSAEPIPVRGDVPVMAPDSSSDLAVIPPRDDLGDELLYSSSVAGNDRDLTNASVPPDDYLESSEELLRSLAREEAQIRVERSFLESLVTPLGVGSMLMLLLSSAMFGYVIMNPASLSGLSQLFARREVAPSPAPAAVQSAPADIPNSPSLDGQEFVDLGLGNLTTLKTRPTSGLPQNSKPSPTASASPLALPSPLPEASKPSSVAPSSPASPSLRSAPVQPAPISRPNPAPVAPSYPRSSYVPAPTIRRAPAPVSLPTVPIARPQPPIERAPTPTVAPQPRTWHVDTPYDNDRTYDKIQQSNPGAEFVNTPEGGFVRSGSYRSEAEAKAKAQELQNQGIPAEVSK